MGKEKRLFLLAVMTVMISTAGYGATGEDLNSYSGNNPTNKITHDKKVEVTGKNDGKDVGIKLNSGDGKELKLTNTAEIIVDGGTGVKTNIYKDKKGDPVKNPIGSGKNIFINKGKITVNNGIGIDLYAIDKITGSNKFENEKELIVNNGIGIKLGSINGSAVNNEKIEVNGGTGVAILKTGTSFENKGTIFR